MSSVIPQELGYNFTDNKNQAVTIGEFSDYKICSLYWEWNALKWP